MRTVTPAFNTSLAGVTSTFAQLWKITRKDGTSYYFTNHDTPVVIAGIEYAANTGFTATAALNSAIAIGSQNVELTLPMTPGGITEDDLRARRFESASCTLYVADYTAPVNGTMILFSGKAGRIIITDKHYAKIEVLPLFDPNTNIADEIYSSSCRNFLGDANCGFPIMNMAVNFTVTGLIGGSGFTIDTMAGQPDDFFALGQLKWLTGDNALLVTDVRSNNLAMRSVSLFFPMPFNIAVGDTGIMLPGCDKQLTTCNLKFNNVVNFRGEPFSPAFGV